MMATPIDAVRALRWNYRWRGVWRWCRSRIPAHGDRFGWWMVLAHPSQVVASQRALAEGVTA